MHTGSKNFCSKRIGISVPFRKPNLHMKKPLRLFPLISIFALVPVYSQEPCTQSALAQKPGLIRESKLRGSTYGLTPAEVARARATLTKIHQTIAAGYKPVGLVGDYSYHFSGGTTASTFGYSMYMLKYNCDPSSGDRSKFYIGTDTPTVVRIDANVINPLNFSATDYNDNTFRGYFFIRKLPQKVDGFYYLGDNPAGNAPQNQKEYTWLITYDDQLPFTTLTRKEYLLITKARLEKTKSENASTSKFYDQYLDRVNQALKKNEVELSRPAIVNRTEEELFTGFLEEGARGAYYAIRHNPAYYRKGAAKTTPQFFTIVYSVYEADPVYPLNINAVKRTLDLNLLKGMLGK